MKILWAFLVIASCASTKQKEKVAMALETWHGRPSSELKTHSYFKGLKVKKIKHEDGIEDWVFRDQTRFQTDAYCDSLGGCIGMPTYNCDIAFSIKNDVILGGSRNGSCPDASLMKAP